MQRYRRKERTQVAAVKLDLQTAGFTYEKWGATQRCEPGDWLVNNQGEVYTVDADTFDRTYRNVSLGVYEKNAPVWAEQAETPGAIQTQEGSTAYQPGDFLVFNDPDRKDGYAMTREKFHSLYEAVKE